MAYELTDDQVIRFSYGKSMGRPSLQDLRSSFQFGNRDFLVPTASGGNPGLSHLSLKILILLMNITMTKVVIFN